MADVRRGWKYEKDVFGRKHRKYFLENVFGADVFDMKTFRALRVKMSRDYVGFFRELNRRYERGEFKSVAQESQKIARQVIIILDGMIDSGVIDKRDVDAVVERVDFLNEQKDRIVEKSGQVKALKGRLTNIEQETGITPEALGVTESIIRRGAKREIQKGREGALPFLKRTTPRTLGLGREIFGGVGAAALGPFAPLARMVGGMGGDILGLGKGLLQKVGERKERRLGRMLAPLSGGIPREGAMGGLGFAGRGRTSASHTARTARRKEGSSVLMDFFNRGAYKARWTKQLLKSMKGIGDAGKGLAGGLLDKLKGAAGGFLPAAGKAAGVVALGVGMKLATDKFLELRDAVSEYIRTKRSEQEAQDRAFESWKTWMQHLEGLIARSKVDQKAIDQVTTRIETRKELLGAAPTMVRDAFAPSSKDTMKQIQKESTQILQQIQQEGVESLSVPKQKRFLELGGVNVPSSQEDLMTQVKKLAESVADLSKNITKTRQPDPIREPGIGNPWDSSDPWITGLAASELEVGD
jgi:hypothetical protein